VLRCNNSHCAEEYRTPQFTGLEDTCWYCVKKARLEGWAKNCGCNISMSNFVDGYGPLVAYINNCDNE
jgi:hypothetical protein